MFYKRTLRSKQFLRFNVSTKDGGKNGAIFDIFTFTWSATVAGRKGIKKLRLIPIFRVLFHRTYLYFLVDLNKLPPSTAKLRYRS